MFEGQFFPEFNENEHVCSEREIPKYLTRFCAVDYGFDMLAALVIGVDTDGNCYVLREHCEPNLTLSQAALRISDLCRGECEYAVASPDLWNRRQDSGRSGFEIMQGVRGMPPMVAADDRRIAGWRIVREYLSGKPPSPMLRISSSCKELIRSLPLLLCDTARVEDAAGEPHSVTHAPEALRYGLMSRYTTPKNEVCDFIIPRKTRGVGMFE